MTFDAFTILAQLVNFVVLIGAMHAVLYRPVRRALEARRLAMAREWAEAESARRDAEREAAALREEREAWSASKRERMEALEREVDTQRGEALEEVEHEARVAREAHADALRRDVEEARASVLHACGRLLRDELTMGFEALADADVDALCVAAFERSLGELDEGALRQVRSEVASADVRVYTAHPASDRLRAGLSEVIEGVLGDAVSVRFEVDASLLAGFTVRIGSREWGWSAAGFSAAFESVARAVADEVARAPHGSPA